MNIKITEDKDEIINLGQQIAADNPERYSDAMINRLWEKYADCFPGKDVFYANVYSAIYCQTMYGTSFPEYTYYRFAARTHEQKKQYITWYSRYAYMTFLNCVKDLHLLDNKYEAYTFLKPYYKRDAMLLSGESDYPAFCKFAAKHKSIFVKPVNLELAEGVHRLDITDGTDLYRIFQSLLAEARNLTSFEIKRPILHQLILEEVIVPSQAISQFNPTEMSLLRVTTVAVNGRIHFFYPCFRMMCGDGKTQQGEVYSMDALIDAETGIVTTGGMNGVAGETEYHPVSGVKIKGFAMPEWYALKKMLTDAANQLPSLRYIGWDVVHTDKGWLIIEGNTNGEFFFQLCLNHGVKDEFEKLIGFQFNMPPGLRWDKILQEPEEDKK